MTPKHFTQHIINMIQANDTWDKFALEFDGDFQKFERWCESEPLNTNEIDYLHLVNLKWRSEIEKTASNKRRIAGHV